MIERLQKILSQAGVASRREAEALIAAGRVFVNGAPATLGQSADRSVDDIVVDGRPLPRAVEWHYLLLQKPAGVEVTMERSPASKGAIVADLLPAQLRSAVFPVGRLDQGSEGLLLLTNDGELALRLTHPRYHHEKEYRVQLQTAMSDAALEQLREGMVLDGRRTKPFSVRRISSNTIVITLTEGKNRQIRRMCEAVGCTVRRLVRTRIATLSDETLESGEMRPLTPEEVARLRADAGLTPQPA